MIILKSNQQIDDREISTRATFGAGNLSVMLCLLTIKLSMYAGTSTFLIEKGDELIGEFFSFKNTYFSTANLDLPLELVTLCTQITFHNYNNILMPGYDWSKG